MAVHSPLGACCVVANVKTGGVAISQGQSYWIVLKTNSEDNDVWAGWNHNTTDMISPLNAASNTGRGWQTFANVPPVALAIVARQ